MSRRWRVLLGVAIVVTACSAPPDRVDVQPAEPTPRTTWTLRHTVAEPGGLRVTTRSIDQLGESTTVGIRGDPSERCSVRLSVPGQGGPEHKVGEKLPTSVDDRPGFRSGAGAEGVYLMWQLPDGTWLDVSCEPDDRAAVDEVARAVRLRTTSLAVPFALAALPDELEVSSVSQDLENGEAQVYLGRVEPPSRLSGSDVVISYEGADPIRRPSGRETTINGRTALVDEDRRSPAVWVLVNGSDRYVDVSAVTSDTGPYPDRSGDLPTLMTIARGLTFAEDPDDRSTWFPADRALG